MTCFSRSPRSWLVACLLCLGFWQLGQGAYIPALDLAIGLAITQQHASKNLSKIMHALLDQLIIN